jgi:hypothetical protein
MKVEPSTEFDCRWESEGSAYRVYFWSLLKEGAPGTVPLWESSTFRVSEVLDVIEVIQWAQTNAHGRLVTVFVEVPLDTPGPPAIVQVHGTNPTSG